MRFSVLGVRNELYYGIKDLDYTKSAIFVFPHGKTDGMPWPVGDNKDHVFFEEFLQILKDNLSIDESKFFVSSFIFSSMFSLKLLLSFLLWMSIFIFLKITENQLLDVVLYE